jgi:membrane associated rhomboid family serine protease
MTENVDLIHSAIIEDIFYLGKALERKRLHLKYSLYILVAGVFIALIMGLIFRLVYGEIQ